MLALKPEYKLRKGKCNILLYRIDKDTFEIVDQKILHPNIAIILAFLNGLNSNESVISAIGYLLNMSEEKANNTFDEITTLWKPYLFDTNYKVRDDSPMDFIMPADSFNPNKLVMEAPLTITLNITQNCGQCKCIYCYAENKEHRNLGVMPVKLILDIIRQAKELNVEVITLSGGDAFTHRNIMEIIALIVESGIDLQLSTKQFLNNDKIAQLKETGVKIIQISIDALDNKLSEVLTGVPRFAEKTLDTIERLLNQGFKVTTNSVVTGINCHDILNLVNVLLDMGVYKIRLSQYYRSAYRHSNRLFLSKEDGIFLRKFVDQQNKKLGKPVISLSGDKTNYFDTGKKNDYQKALDEFINRPMCSAGRESILIIPNGKVLPCEQLPCHEGYVLGDTKTDSIKDIWNSERFRRFFLPDRSLFADTVCYDCRHFETCVIDKGWCMRDAWKAYDNIYQINPMCPEAQRVEGKSLS